MGTVLFNGSKYTGEWAVQQVDEDKTEEITLIYSKCADCGRLYTTTSHHIDGTNTMQQYAKEKKNDWAFCFIQY